MKTVVMLLQALCGDNKAVYSKVRHELTELITCNQDGYRYGNSKAALNLAMELDLSDYIGATVSRQEAARFLKRQSRNTELINTLLGSKGATFNPCTLGQTKK